ncbi:MAG: BrnT family toxin [Bdellovibrionales bacterium]|nr:BrnT family toxin [Bdellovibrionales bacterium]
MRFEWDEKKNRSNRQKHGIWFEEAQQVFDDVTAIRFYDTLHSDDEDRFVLLGMSGSSRTLVVVFCERESENKIRIISARKATKKEIKIYEEGI